MKLEAVTDQKDKKNNLYQSEQQIHLLDQKALNELLNLNVYQLAQAKTFQSPGNNKRKNSDEDIYVEETLLFSYDPNLASQNSDGGATPRKLSGNLASTQTLNTLIQQVETLRQNILIEVHKWNEVEDDEFDKSLLQRMMSDEYVDEEIDKLLETLSTTIKMNANNLGGDFIENDIRLSESIRDSLDEIKMMQRAPNNKSGIIERRRFLQRYMEVAELLGVSLTVEHLLPALNEVSKITDGYNGIRDFIMPFFNHFFQSDKIDETIKQELQQEVISLLVEVSKIMTHEDRAEKVLPIILENIRDDSDEERRILGLELVDRLAEQMGKEICQSFLMYEIVSLQDDPIYRVRKETVMRMINISKVLGKEIFLGILFPVFKKLAGDQIWGVRRSAVEQLPFISNLCPIEIKNGILIEMFKKFSQDSSKWVKMATFQFLGPFIASYEGIDPNPLLVDYYINMCEQNKSPQPDNEVPYHCAYNFPAVLQTLGAKSWTKLQPVHDLLVKDSRIKVRRTLAFSLHEIAKILGPEIAERELMPVLNLFLRDQIEVKEGVTENLPKFIEVLKPEQRETYIDKLAQTQIDPSQWRKRVIQATQVRKFSKIFSSVNVNKYYVPIFFLLCQDQVAEVRIEAARAAKNLAYKLYENEELFTQFISKVILLKQSNRYNLRQTFIYICESMMNAKELFQKYLIKDFCDLQRDRIINVRMVLSEVLDNHYKKHENGGLIQELKELRLMMKHLKLDIRDVSDILADINVVMQEGDEQDEIKLYEQDLPQQQETQIEVSQNILLQDSPNKKSELEQKIHELDIQVNDKQTMPQDLSETQESQIQIEEFQVNLLQMSIEVEISQQKEVKTEQQNDKSEIIEGDEVLLSDNMQTLNFNSVSDVSDVIKLIEEQNPGQQIQFEYEEISSTINLLCACITTEEEKVDQNKILESNLPLESEQQEKEQQLEGEKEPAQEEVKQQQIELLQESLEQNTIVETEIIQSLLNDLIDKVTEA